MDNEVCMNIIQSILDGNLENAQAEIETELSARSMGVVDQGTEFVMNSISDEINGVCCDDDDYNF